MNNGKVRIYDLSRELNLDNKDILALCEQLNIPFKSHSSTITETEAELIRANAEKHAASHSSPKSAPARQNKPRTEPQAESGERTGDRKKQQILEIRTHAPRTNPKSQAPGSPSSPQQKLNRPQRPNQSKEPVSEVDSAPENQETETEVIEMPQEYSPREAKPAPKSQQPASSSPERPRLSAPPVRPSAAAPGGNRAEKPTLKLKTKSEPGEAAAGAPPQPAATSGEGQPVRRQGSPKDGSSGGGKDKDKEKAKRLPELVRPQLVRPEPQAGRTAEAEKTEETEEETTEVLPLLLRPTPPRPPKKAKKREEEEDDVQEFADKTGKVGLKAKRRGKPVDEEDDDLESDLDDLPETVQVSLSIARPAKQKARPAAAKPTATALPAQNKAKKAAPSRGDQQASTKTKAQGQKTRDQQGKQQRPEKVVLTGNVTMRELATELGVAETEIIKNLFFKGMAVNITQTLDLETASMVARDLGVEVEIASEESEARKSTEMIEVGDLESLEDRPPVVTVMGHVDHGKTTLLDTIRKTKVAAGEAGGITQHIGAYHVDVDHNGETQQVVFLDTPGHEAFTAMRARGARVTDIAILVVAADDGVRPQTIEAIGHAQAAEVPIVVAINKIDKEGAQPDRVKQELTEYGLVPEEWGGETIMVPVSAIKGENLDTLLEMILLVAEVQELQANPNRDAKGTVIEAHLDKARGPVATLLVQNGTLRVGDILVAGSSMGKVRAMIDDRGERVDAASPSFAVEVLGLSEVPAAGDEFEVFQNEKEARAVADSRADEHRQSRLQQAMASRRVTLNALSQQAKEGQLKELNLIIKADVQGSLEAILGALRQLPQNEVQVRVLFSAPGEVTETDVDLAAASDAVIVGFNTTFASGARHSADAAGVDVREYNIIYNLLDDIQGAMEGLLEPEMVEEHLGTVEVRAVFPSSKGTVAGCYVLSGKVIRNCKVRVRRNNQVIYEGALDSLRRIKDDVKEVNAGFECGIGLDKFHEWVNGDIIEAFRMVSKRRTLSPN